MIRNLRPSLAALVISALAGAACSSAGTTHGEGSSTGGAAGNSTATSEGGGTTTTTISTTGAGGSGSTDAGPSSSSTTIALQTQISGQFVGAIGGGGGNVMATAEAIGPDEIFTITDLDGALADGHRVRLAAPNGQYLSAVSGGGGALVASGVTPGDDETFLIHRLAGPGAIGNGDAIALEALHQVEYVSADQGGGTLLGVNEPHAESWETFTVTLGPKASDIPAAQVARDQVIDYLHGIRGQRTIAAQHNKLNDQPHVSTDQIQSITGKVPAMWSADFGFGSEGVDYRAQMTQEAETQWAAGAIVQLMYHNCIPTGDEYCSWDEVGGANPQHLTDSQWSDLVTSGTSLNKAWLARLDTLSTYFAELQSKGVAPLFRPLHEMNQGVFWWAGRTGAGGTAKLWQITHDYLVHTKGFTNIVWVWDLQDFSSLGTDVDGYDPGAAYYDIAALDVYDGGYTTADYTTMSGKAGAKLIAVGECSTPPTPAELTAQPDWAFFMLWPDFIQQNQGALPGLYKAPNVVTLGQMPGWK